MAEFAVSRQGQLLLPRFSTKEKLRSGLRGQIGHPSAVLKGISRVAVRQSDVAWSDAAAKASAGSHPRHLRVS